MLENANPSAIRLFSAAPSDSLLCSLLICVVDECMCPHCEYEYLATVERLTVVDPSPVFRLDVLRLASLDMRSAQQKYTRFVS